MIRVADAASQSLVSAPPDAGESCNSASGDVEQVSVKYYIRPRREENPKKWAGPYDAAQLKDLAVRRLFSKDLHEYSEDRLNWLSARQIWGTLFPKGAATVIAPAPPAAPVESPVISAQTTAEVADTRPIAVEDLPEWYLAVDGQQQGPYSMSDLRALATQGRIQNEDLVWNPSFGEEWVEVRNIPAISSPAPVEELPEIDTNAGQTAKTPPFAVASLVLGFLFLCGLGSVLAIVFGHLALASYQQPQKPQTGKWMAITGLALGYLGLLMILIIGIAGLIYMVGFRR